MSGPSSGGDTSRAVRFLGVLVPETQRRAVDEVADRLDLDVGDTVAKRSGFWAMLVLSGVIAVAGVVTDSTATVIGAMIVAPLATPILGVGLGITVAAPAKVGRSALYVLGGLVTVVVLGWAIMLVVPDPSGVLANSQVTGRTSPGVGDLVAAFATGFAGALALARRDLADVLPGIAIAISLVPPLGVVGVCLGGGDPSLAVGALVLFASNAVALVVASTVVFTGVGYASDAYRERARSGPHRVRRAYVVVAVALVVVAIPMVVNTVQAALADRWLGESRSAAQEWLGTTDDADIEDVRWQGGALVIEVRSPGGLPDVDTLQASIDDLIPWQPDVVVVHTVGELITPRTG